MIKRLLKSKFSKKKKVKLEKKKEKKEKKKISHRVKIIMYKKYLNLGDDDATNNKKKQKKLCKCVNYEVSDSSSNLNNKDVELNKCNEPVVNGTDFCQKHQNCLSFLRKSLSGYEVPYQPETWSHPYIEGSHNCYAYFLNDKSNNIEVKCKELCLQNNKSGCPKKIDECQDLIPQPGDHYLLNKYGNLKKKERKYTCPNMHNKLLSDNPFIKPSPLFKKCPKNHYKGAAVIDRGNTFHFYRQNKDGTWSHKPGVLPVTDKDASNKKIYIPHFADRDYSDRPRDNPITYNDFCGYYCLPLNAYIETNMA